jgi:hypothetical protein
MHLSRWTFHIRKTPSPQYVSLDLIRMHGAPGRQIQAQKSQLLAHHSKLLLKAIYPPKYPS